MKREDLIERTMTFALRVLKLAEAMPKGVSGRTISSQIARCGCSVAANYRAALRGKSNADFINKVTIVLEEADETAFWIELTRRAELLPESRLNELHNEAIELTKIFNATRTTARGRQN